MPPQLDSLIADMEAFGLVIDRDLRWDGAVVRLKMAGQRGADRPGWFIGKEVGGKHYAHYGTWQDRDRDEHWTDNGAGTPHCVEQWRQLDALREQWARQEQEQAAKTAAEMWAQADEAAAANHPYVLKKGVKPHGLRALRPEGDNLLLVPYLDESGNIATIQTISPEGDKLLLKHGRVKGCCHPIPGDEDTIHICEGWATGATINELTGRKVLVACSASNLRAVAETARKQRPDARFVIAADNDHKTPGNPGLKHAREAARAIDAEVVIPEGDGTDFNDMVTAGFPGRAAEILGAEPDMTGEETWLTEYPETEWLVPGILTAAGFAVIAGPPKFGKSWMMLDLSMGLPSGSPVWGGRRVNGAGVLYLALEDPPARIHNRMRMMDRGVETKPKDLRSMYIAYKCPRLDEGHLEWVRAYLDRHPEIRLVIADTLQRIRPVSNGRRNLYQAEYDDLGALQKFYADRGVAFIGVHHLRKRNSRGELVNPMDEISGSTGIQGVADTIMVCTREGMSGKLFITGREVEEETWPLTFSKVTMTWTLREPAEADPEFLQLAEWFKTRETITAKEAAEGLTPGGGKPDGVKPDSLRRYWKRKLDKWASEGKLSATEPKYQGDTAVYSPADPLNIQQPCP